MKKAKPRKNPESTQVSSPIRDKMKRRAAATSFVNEDENHGYARDGFVIPDDVEESDDAFASADDSFSPVQRRGTNLQPQRSKGKGKAKTLGPPITGDAHLNEASVPNLHLEVMHGFVAQAKMLDDSIRNPKGIKKPLFTERNLRDMALNWTTTLEEMREIENIDVGRVERFGSKFITLLKQCHAHYDEIMTGDIDQNHKNVINLISDDELIDEDDLEPDEDEDDVESQYNAAESQSRYFQSKEVTAFNEELSQIEKGHPTGSSSRAPSKQSAGSKGRGGGKRGSGTSKGRGSRNGGARRTSNGKSATSTGGGTSSGVKKSTTRRRSSSGRTSRAATSSKPSTKAAASKDGGDIRTGFSRGTGSGGGRNGGGGGFGGGIGMMPT